GEAALRRVIAAANADPAAIYAPLMRASSFDVLVESAAQSGDGAAVVRLLAERLGTPRPDRCALGISSWNQLVVATLDSAGRPDLEHRDIPGGRVMTPRADAVSPEIPAPLAGCHRIAALPAARYFGAPRLLDDRAAWGYHAGTPRAPAGPATLRELVVSDV